jgi:hypothetical protein
MAKSRHDPAPVHLWEVLGSEPLGVDPSGKERGYPQWDNLKFSVVARTMDRVMAVSRETYPEMRFHSIQKRNYLGKQSVLIDDEVFHEEER